MAKAPTKKGATKKTNPFAKKGEQKTVVCPKCGAKISV